jgi:hypothetical protein
MSTPLDKLKANQGDLIHQSFSELFDREERTKRGGKSRDRSNSAQGAERLITSQRLGRLNAESATRRTRGGE